MLVLDRLLFLKIIVFVNTLLIDLWLIIIIIVVGYMQVVCTKFLQSCIYIYDNVTFIYRACTSDVISIE